MVISALRGKVIEEIGQIPEVRLPEVYTLLHFFRLGVETTHHAPQDIMQFAGRWQDMPDEDFQEFLREIQERRQCAFSGRMARETCID